MPSMTTEQVVRSALTLALIDGFAFWFLWDGYVGYARENAASLAESLNLDRGRPTVVDEKLTAAEGSRLEQKLTQEMSPDAVEKLLGSPALVHGEDWYYLGPGGNLRVHLERGQVRGAQWTAGKHTETDLAWQRGIGFSLAVLGIAAAVYLVHVLATRRNT